MELKNMFPKNIEDALNKAGVVYGVGPDGAVTDIKSGKSGNKLILNKDLGIDLDTEEEIVPKVHGKYQSKRGIYDFMCSFGNINFLSKTAVIDGKFFDTLNLEGVKFQMTLKDDNTFDFEEVVAEGDISKTTEADHQRFIEMFEESVISGFREKSVYSDFIFHIEYPITDENRKSLERNFGELEEGQDKVLFQAYLIVEPKKPYNNLLNFLDEDENENPTNMNIEQSETLNPELRTEIPKNADLSFLDDDEDDVEAKEPPIPLPIAPKEELTGTRAQIAEEFLEAKKQKLVKLQETLGNYRNELKTAKNQQNLAFTKIRECNEEIKTLSSRIDSLGIQEPLNGYFVYIPMVLSEKTYLEESVRKTIQDKLIAMNYPNADYFMHLFDNAIYQIHIGCNTEEGLAELEDYKNVIQYFKDFDLVSQQTKFFVEDKKLFYEGQMDHADIINKLIKLGFSENPEFNEMCEAQHNHIEHEYGCNCEHGCDNQESYEKPPEEQFEIEVGYPIGEDFIFSILYDTNGDLGLTKPKVCVDINPLSYWQNESYQYDQNIRDILYKKFPILAQTNNLEEILEGHFFLLKDDETTMDLREAIQYLASSGLKYSKSFQDFMSAKDSTLIDYLVSAVNPDIIIA